MQVNCASSRVWTTRKHRTGVKVEVCNEPNSAFPRYRASMTVDGPMQPLLAVLDEVEHFPRWVHGTVKSCVVETLSPHEKLIYCVSQNPWPVQNRDYYAKTSVRTCGDDVLIQWQLVEGPPSTEYVRVQKMVTDISLRPEASSERFSLTMEAHIEPGGAIPVWVVDWFIAEVPFNTLINARKWAHKRQSATGQSAG